MKRNSQIFSFVNTVLISLFKFYSPLPADQLFYFNLFLLAILKLLPAITLEKMGDRFIDGKCEEAVFIVMHFVPQ